MPDGATKRQALESVERQTGKRPAELIGPPIPLALAYLWRWFLDIHRGRGSTGYGPAALSYGEIDAWRRLMSADPSPWEIDILRALDAAYLRFASEQSKRNKPKHEPKKPPRRSR